MTVAAPVNGRQGARRVAPLKDDIYIALDFVSRYDRCIIFGRKDGIVVQC
jgi:hypothetical protein